MSRPIQVTDHFVEFTLNAAYTELHMNSGGFREI